MAEKKRLNKQAIILSLNIFISGLIFPLQMFDSEQLIVMIPTLVLIVATIALNYWLKPDLNQYIIFHCILGFITWLVCFSLIYCLPYGVIFLGLISYFFDLPMKHFNMIFSALEYLVIILYWIVPLLSLLVEIIFLIKQRVYRKAKEFILLLVSHVGICLMSVYIVEYFILDLFFI